MAPAGARSARSRISPALSRAPTCRLTVEIDSPAPAATNVKDDDVIVPAKVEPKGDDVTDAVKDDDVV